MESIPSLGVPTALSASHDKLWLGLAVVFVCRSVGQKIGEFLETGKIQV